MFVKEFEYMNHTSQLVIHTKCLSKSFGEIQALKSLDLEVPKNSIVGFLGPNGAGKTTTIRLLLGLNRPTAGSGTIFGLDIIKDNLEIRRRIGYLAQSPRFYEDMTPREILRFTARFFYKGPKAKIEQRVLEMLELVSLTGKADRPTRGFSGGERQRLGIAQAQINEPELLILDEPAAALDPMGRYDVLRIMEQIRERSTIFYSTHILDDVQRISDRVVILNRGEMIAQGQVAAMLAGDQGAVFSLTTQGDPSQTRSRVSEQPWVTNLELSQVDGQYQWNVAVNDLGAAQSRLLRLVMEDEHIEVVSFGRQKLQLEEIFMRLVQENGK
jgi:ABC-2 type transport system ATP-binding protein